MKTIANFFIVFFIVGLVFFISCDKDSSTINTKDNSTEPKAVAPGGGSGSSDDCCKDYKTLLDQSKDEWCCKAGTNCLPCVIIEGNSPLIANFEVAISNGPSGVKSYFLGDEYLDLFPSLSDNNDMLLKLQSGSYSVEKLLDPYDANHIIYKAYNAEGDYFGLTLRTE